MVTTVFATILTSIFTLLGLIHLYWFFGGKWGLGKVIPTKENHQSNLQAIPKFATLIVALILLSFGLMYLSKAGIQIISFPNWLVNFAYWFIPLIFILRAIGEFNYVGYFKKIRNTEFAKADSKIFTPLCLTIGIMGVLIQLMNT